MSGASQVAPCRPTSSRSASLRAQATHSAPATSARVSSAVTTPPAPRVKPPSGRGSWGARLLTTIGEQCGSVRETYAFIEPPGRRRSTLSRKGLTFRLITDIALDRLLLWGRQRGRRGRRG